MGFVRQSWLGEPDNIMQGEQSKAVKISNMSGIINIFYDLISQMLILDVGRDRVYLLS